VSTYISESLKNQIISTDLSRCCYCLTTEANSGIPMTYDHIRPVSKNGETSFDNLCLACRTCNEFKGDYTVAVENGWNLDFSAILNPFLTCLSF
jgi:5-methylcytosine-specific restriction endonuclease McrA